LDLSKRSLVWAYAFLILLGITEGAAAYLGDKWRQGWIWASAAVLILIALAMNWIGDPYFDRLRVAVGLEEPSGKKGKKGTPAPQGLLPETPAGEETLRQLRRSPRPWLLALVGIVGLAAILWLMVLKPDLGGIGGSPGGLTAAGACPDGPGRYGRRCGGVGRRGGSPALAPSAPQRA